MHLVVPYCSYRNWEREREKQRERERQKGESDRGSKRERERQRERESEQDMGRLLMERNLQAPFGNKGKCNFW